MVSLKDKYPQLENGEIDLEAWLQKVKVDHRLENIDLLRKAAFLAQETSKGLTTFYGHPCIEKGLEMASIVLHLKLDQDAVAAALMLSTVQHTKYDLDRLSTELNPVVSKLIRGVEDLHAIKQLQKPLDKERNQTQIDRLRKLFLAMVSDIRVVMIKLAERTSIMRGIKNINPKQRREFAQETMDIYAPLANRLGIGQIKWELEDTAFHYIDPDAYKKIVKFLSERRSVREERIQETIEKIRENLHKTNIHAEITGRAKHIYSIYLKTKRKDVDYHNIYDFSAVRILVPTIEDCYSALSVVHALWEHIPAEFDDYIATPKPNGYQSIHTAVIGPDGKNMEIQIRTVKMHEEAELGVAAHWMYKEAKPHETEYSNKITTLRQIIDWHRNLSGDNDEEGPYDQILKDRVYVFTPKGEILDLPEGATPLDCAYHIHSEVGNHCRGAKINGHIVPLTYHLKTGDKIDILTHPQGNPSRDWLNPEFGYITTPRARSKIAHWFRSQDFNQNIEDGKRILEKEFSRLGEHFNILKIAHKLNFKDEDGLLASLGRGNTRIIQITHLVEAEHSSEASKTEPIHLPGKKTYSKTSGMKIAGIGDLLTRVALCCKPIPGDRIIGFITQGRGVTIHKIQCNNITHLPETETNRLIEVSWDKQHTGFYYVDIQIKAQLRDSLLKEIANFLANARIHLVNLNSILNRNRNLIIVTLTIEINALDQVKAVLTHMNQMPGVLEAHRLRDT